MLRFQDILKDADSEIGSLNSKKMELQEELAKEEMEQKEEEALQTREAEVCAPAAAPMRSGHIRRRFQT